jgi:DNA polymerase-1
MKIVNTSDVMEHLDFTAAEREWVYNGLDCCVTAEVLNVLLPRLNKYTTKTYQFSRDLQAPVLRMRLRGVKIDEVRRLEVIEHYENLIDGLETDLERLVRESTGFIGFNWRSLDHLRHLFYNVFRIPQSRLTKGGQQVMDREALEMMEEYSIAYWFIWHMKKLREVGKRLSVLEAPIDSDGRFRTSYNIAGTSTGRLSSSLSEFGTGGNAQNIEEFLRSIFIADDGMKMANFDAEQGESRCVGAIEWNIFHRGVYLDASESGDLHTYAARLCWPTLPWTGKLGEDNKIAERIYDRHYSRRHMCKILGHGSNYGGKPETLAAQTKIDIKLVQEFQSKYFKAFPDHLMWHDWVAQAIRNRGWLVSLTGRQRHFYGRRDDPKMHRDALAYDPQGSLSDIVNHGMLNVDRAGDCELLMQNHDSIIIQYPEEREDEIIPKIQTQLRYPVELRYDRTLTIPYGCKTGWNWGDYSEGNPNGLRKYQPGDKRKRG